MADANDGINWSRNRRIESRKQRSYTRSFAASWLLHWSRGRQSQQPRVTFLNHRARSSQSATTIHSLCKSELRFLVGNVGRVGSCTDEDAHGYHGNDVNRTSNSMTASSRLASFWTVSRVGLLNWMQRCGCQFNLNNNYNAVSICVYSE